MTMKHRGASYSPLGTGRIPDERRHEGRVRRTKPHHRDKNRRQRALAMNCNDDDGDRVLFFPAGLHERGLSSEQEGQFFQHQYEIRIGI
jgi:hypothetical protein